MKFNDHFLSWVLIYAILVYAVDFLLNLFDINNYLFVLLFAGFIFALGSSIFYSVLYKNDFRLNGWFLIWTLTNALSYWLINLFLSLFTIQSQFIHYLLFGLIFHLVTYFFKYNLYGRFKIKDKNSKLILAILGLFILLFFISSLNTNPITEISATNLNYPNSFFDKIKSLFSSINPNLTDCPQLAIPLLPDNKLWVEVMSSARGQDDPFDGWEVKSYDVAELFGLAVTPQIQCYKGDKEGQNPSRYYCGYWDNGDNWGMEDLIYMEKTFINSDGSIGKTIQRTFVNVYDENKEYIKTICGASPEDVSTKKFKGKMQDLDDFFNLK